MKKAVKRGMACMCMMALTFQNSGAHTAAVRSPVQSIQPADTQNAAAEKSNGVVCRVDTNRDGTAGLAKVSQTDRQHIIISSKLTVGGVSYTVTTVGARAFANCAQMKRLTLPDTIKTILARAFTGADKLETIVLTGSNVVDFNINAFRNLDTKNMTIEISGGLTDEQFEQQKENLKAAGFEGRIKRAEKSIEGIIKQAEYSRI